MKRILFITMFAVFASSVFAISPIDTKEECSYGNVVECREIQIFHGVAKNNQNKGLLSIENDIKNQNNLKF